MSVPLTASPHNAQDQQPGANNALVALLDHAVVAPLATPGWLRVTGEDRVRWLNGMLTNSIQTLTPGDGTYNFALSAQGRIQADATVFALADELRIETNRPAELLAHLDRFIIMDDVELTLLPSHHGILVAGPNAAALLTGLLNITLPAAPLALVQTTWQDEPIDLIHAYSPLVPRYELWSTPSAISTLSAALVDAGAVPAGAETVEDLRMLEGTPLYGVDIRDKELPQETAQARALHFSKGCYLGQEIVERIHSRGNVHRTFAAFALTGDLPAPGTALSAADTPQSENARPLGELTSTRLIHLPGGPLQLALGYIRRDALDRAQPLIFPGGQAVPVTLPLAAALSKSVQSE